MVGFIKQDLCLALAADHAFLPDQSDGWRTVAATDGYAQVNRSADSRLIACA